MKWVSMAKQPHKSLRSPCTMPSVGWSGIKFAAIGLWRPVFWSDELQYISPKLPAPMHSAKCTVWWRRNNGLGLFFMVQARPLSSSEWKS